RGIAWRVADSMSLRSFLGLPLDKNPPDHSTLSRTRRLLDLEVHNQVFCWILAVLAKAGLVKGKLFPRYGQIGSQGDIDHKTMNIQV
ncbi:MAG: transposase, partial [Bacteroidota bacterium]